MNLAEIKETYSRLQSLLEKGEIGSVISKLSSENMAVTASVLDDVRYSYNSLLDFSSTGVVDPLSKNILVNIIEQLYSIVDEWRDRESLRYGATTLRFKAMREWQDEVGSADWSAFERWTSDYASALAEDDTTRLDDISQHIFNAIWASRDDDNVINLLRRVFGEGSDVRRRDRELFIGALLMSLESSFSSGYLEMLIELCSSSDVHIRARAMVCVVVTMVWYHKRLAHFPSVVAQIDFLMEDASSRKEMLTAIRSVLRSPQASAIMDKVTNEITPQISAQMDVLERRGSFHATAEDWAEMTSDNQALSKSMKQLDKWHDEGADIFFATVSHLKSFGFFRRLSNWLVPFTRDNNEIQSAIARLADDVREAFVEKISETATLCESDKFSVLLSIAVIPEAHRGSICTVYLRELDLASDIKSDDGLDEVDAGFCKYVTSFVHDIYRLFNVHPSKRDMNNPFDALSPFVQSRSFMKYLSDDELYGMADYCVEHDVINLGTAMYRILILKDSENIDLCKKMAYCLIKVGDYRLAVDYLDMAEMLGDTKLWTVKKKALCYSKLGDVKGELECLLKIASSRPDDMSVVESIARCYESLALYSEALRYYFEAEYKQSSSSLKSSIVRCYYSQEKFDQALAQIKRIENKCSDDFIIEGHIYNIMQQQGDAIKSYLSGAIQCKSVDEFIDKFDVNATVAARHGLTKEDRILVCEIVRKIKEGEK